MPLEQYGGYPCQHNIRKFLTSWRFSEKRKYINIDVNFGNWEKNITENKILRTNY